MLTCQTVHQKMDVERDTKKDWLVLLRGALDNAVDDGAINENVARTFQLPKQERKNPKIKGLDLFPPKKLSSCSIQLRVE